MTTYFCPNCGNPHESRCSIDMTGVSAELAAVLKPHVEVDLFNCADDCPMKNNTLSPARLSDAHELARYGAVQRFDVTTGELIKGEVSHAA